MIIGFYFIACSNGDNEPVCICTDGTIILIGENGCNKNCTTEKITGERVHGIPVTNREGVPNFEDMVTAFIEAFNWLTDTQKAFVITNINEVKIIQGNMNAPTILNNILTAGNDSDGVAIWGELDYWLTLNGID